MLDEQVSVEQVRGMLTLRRAELATTLATEALRLTQIEARLRIIEHEGQLPTTDVVVKRLPAVRLVELTDTAASFRPEDIGPVVHPLCAELGRRLDTADITPAGRLTCYYERIPGDEDRVLVHAAVPAAADPGKDLGGLTVADLPAAETAATIVHRGRMDAVLPTWQAMARWIDANGYQSSGPQRELYLECEGDPDTWVTELQEPVTR
jgi:effector-binding domain-containing protein